MFLLKTNDFSIQFQNHTKTYGLIDFGHVNNAHLTLSIHVQVQLANEAYHSAHLPFYLCDCTISVSV